MRRFVLLLAFAPLLLIQCGASGPRSSPLVDAVRSGDVAAVRALCAGGADPNEPVGGNNWPPLMHALPKNQLCTAAAPIDFRPQIHPGEASGTTPLLMASR